MSLRQKLSSPFLATALVFGTAVIAAQSSAAAGYSQATQVESALGRITSVQGNTFTLDVSKQPKSANGGSTAKSNNVLTLTLDQDTDVHGKIVIGADANVTYREEDGNNIAISVRIVQQSS